MKLTKAISLRTKTLLVLLSFLIHSANGQFFQTQCSDHSQCASNQFLQCLNGFCQCDSRFQIYDYKLNQCATLAGKHCDVKNGFGPKCSRNSACVLSKCECQPGYSVSTEFICKPNFQHPCKIPQDCEQDKGLTCFVGSCQCYNASLSYQGMFGCVDPANPYFIEMMTALKRTENLLVENRIDLEDMIGNLDSQEYQTFALDKLLTGESTQIQQRQLFTDSYSNTNTDLLGSSQTQNTQQAGQGLGGLLNIFRGLGNLGGLSQLLGNPLGALGRLPGQGQQGGYAASGVPQNLGGLSQLLGNPLGALGRLPGQGQQGGYAASGVPQNQQSQRGNNGIFTFLTSLLNLFNQFVPVVRQFKMLINPLRIIQRLLRNVRTLVPAGNTAGQYGAPNANSVASGYGAPNTNSAGSYGPPSQSQSQSPGYGPPSSQPAVTGGYNNGPASAPGPAPEVAASQSQNQAIDQYHTLPIQSFQTQSILGNNYNQQGSSQENLNRQQQGFTNQNQQFRNVPQSQNFQTIDNKRPVLQPQPTGQVSNNEYPRHERFSILNTNSEDSSPYLPEHL